MENFIFFQEPVQLEGYFWCLDVIFGVYSDGYLFTVMRKWKALTLLVDIYLGQRIHICLGVIGRYGCGFLKWSRMGDCFVVNSIYFIGFLAPRNPNL